MVLGRGVEKGASAFAVAAAMHPGRREGHWYSGKCTDLPTLLVIYVSLHRMALRTIVHFRGSIVASILAPRCQVSRMLITVRGCLTLAHVSLSTTSDAVNGWTMIDCSLKYLTVAIKEASDTCLRPSLRGALK